MGAHGEPYCALGAHGAPGSSMTDQPASPVSLDTGLATGGSVDDDYPSQPPVEGRRDSAMVLLDPDGKVASWNGDAERLTGYGSSEIIGRHFACFFTAHDVAAERPAALLRQAAAETSCALETWSVRRDGSRFWAHVTVTALHNRDGGLLGFGNVVRDASERLRWANAWRTRREAQHVVQLGSWVWDVPADRMTCSDEVYRLLGVVSRAEPTPVRWLLDRIHPNDVTRVRQAIEHAVRVQTPFSLTHRVIELDGGERVLCWQGYVSRAIEGQVLRMAGTIEDITERARAEAALERESAVTRLLQQVAVAANEAVSPSSALQRALELIASFGDWDAGQAFMGPEQDGDALGPTGPWHVRAPERRPEHETTDDITRGLDVSLARRVLTTHRPEWVADVTAQGEHAAGSATAGGVRAAFAFPVPLADRVAAVLAFFSARVRSPDDTLLEVSRHVGAILGRVFEREAARNALRLARDRFAALFHSSPVPSAITTLAADVFLEVNDRFLELVEYPRGEVIGRPSTELGIWNAGERRATVERLRRNGHLRDLELAIGTRDGEARHVLATLQVIDLDGETCVLGSMIDVTARKRAEESIRESRKLMRALSQQLLDVQEEERTRIARDLHDQVGQALTAVKLTLEALQRAGGDPARVATMVEEGIGAVDHTIQQVRSLSFDLRPSLLDDLGLGAAVASYVKRRVLATGLDARVTVQPAAAGAPKHVQTACFRILQEALTNVLRHAQARRVDVELRSDDDTLELLVRDDGIGLGPRPPESGVARKRGLGLVGMRERALLAGGNFEIESRAGRGTTIRVRLPLGPRTAPSDADER